MISPNPIGGLSFRIAALLVSITCIFYTAVMRSTNRKRLRGRLFLVLLVLTVICCCTGIATTIASLTDLPMRTKDTIAYVGKFIYYIAHMAFVPLFAIYITIVCEVFHKFSKFTFTLFILPFLLLELGVLTNPLTGFIFAKYDYLYYSRGVGVYVAYAISGLYVIFCIVLLGIYWRAMNRLQKVAMFYFLGLALIGTVIQMLIPEIVSELLAESLGLMGIMIMIERDDYRLDYNTHANNRSVLLHDLKNLLFFKRHFYTICVRIENAELYRRVIGSEGYDEIMSKGADFLKAAAPRHEVYRTTGGNFFILCPETSESEIETIIGTIADRIKNGFGTHSGGANILARVLCAKCPEELSDVEDILLLADTDIEDNEKILFRGSDLDFLLRKIEVQKAIVRGLNGDSFKVMYLPVYKKSTKRVFSAEALLTLKDSVLGEVEFRDFMAVSNETGFVEELEYRMIESVFKYLKNGIIRGYVDLRLIAIHIMSVQVLKPELIEKVRSCLRLYQVDPSYITFSVSDSIAIQGQGILETIIDEFEKMGIEFVMANNDMGLLGLNPQVIDRFNGVTIDARRFYDNFDDEQADIILRNRITMIKELNKTVIIRGIQNEDYYNLIKDLPADYLAGDYLSPRVSKNELQVKFWHKEIFWDK